MVTVGVGLDHVAGLRDEDSEGGVGGGHVDTEHRTHVFAVNSRVHVVIQPPEVIIAHEGFDHVVGLGCGLCLGRGHGLWSHI